MTLKLKKKYTKILDEFFTVLNKNSINYVVLRRFDGYPEEIPGDDVKELDVDILISKKDFDYAIELGKDLEFRPANNGVPRPQAIKLVEKGVQKPRKVINNPIRSAQLLVSSISTSRGSSEESERTAYDIACQNKYSYKLYADDVELDMKNHLAHVSPMNGRRYRVDPEVEKKMLQRRKEYPPFFVPSPPDQLAHLITHSIFEYEGHFTNYYTHRCEILRDNLTPAEKCEFQEILELVFYDAADLVYKLAMDNEWNNMRTELESYAQY